MMQDAAYDILGCAALGYAIYALYEARLYAIAAACVVSAICLTVGRVIEFWDASQ